MKKFRVQEKFQVTVWTYIEADTKEEALELLDSGKYDDLHSSDFENCFDETHISTEVRTLEEVEK